MYLAVICQHCSLQIQHTHFYLEDSAYPFYTNNGSLTQEQKNFNYRLSCARIVSENTFGRLKARWRRMIKQNDMDVATVPDVVVACCILHNIWEIHGEEFDDAWLRESRQQSQRWLQPTTVPQADRETDPDKIRETLVNYLFHNGVCILYLLLYSRLPFLFLPPLLFSSNTLSIQ